MKLAIHKKFLSAKKTCSNVLFATPDEIQVVSERMSRISTNPGGISCGSKVCSLTIVVLF